MTTTDTSLIHALKLARLEPSERFTKENITAIHKGLAPHYELLTGCMFPKGAVIVGFGVCASDGFTSRFEFDLIGCQQYNTKGCEISSLYHCRLSTAIERGWVDANYPMFRKPFKWVADRKPTKADVDENGFIAVASNDYSTWACQYWYQCTYRQPWARIEDVKNATAEELANIPEEFKWKEVE